MAVAVQTLPVQFSMKKGQGRGSKVLAMQITVAATPAGDTVTTPLKTVHAAVVSRKGATQVGGAFIYGMDIVSVADGVITVVGFETPVPIVAGAIGAQVMTGYLIAIGSTKEYAT